LPISVAVFYLLQPSFYWHKHIYPAGRRHRFGAVVAHHFGAAFAPKWYY